MAAGIPDSLERLTQADLIGVVRELIGEVGRLRAENEKLSGASAELKTEHQAPNPPRSSRATTLPRLVSRVGLGNDD